MSKACILTNPLDDKRSQVKCEYLQLVFGNDNKTSLICLNKLSFVITIISNNNNNYNKNNAVGGLIFLHTNV